MYRHSRLAAVLGCVAALAVAGCGANGNIAPAAGSAALAQVSDAPIGPGWIHAGSLSYHVPHYMATRATAHNAVSGILFSYYNGPVLTAPKMYLILWGYKKYGDPDKVAPLLKEYLSLMGGSGHNNIYTQYYQALVGVNKKTYITNAKGQLAGVWDDETDAVPKNPTDLDVATESLAAVKHFGYDASGSYIVATPHNHSTFGFGTLWCGYHSEADQAGTLVYYTNLPYTPDAGVLCGSARIKAPKDESSWDEGVTIVEGHEEGESVTDPLVGTGWYNFAVVHGSSKGEIGDVCAWVDIANDTFGSKSYTMQPMYSNASESCVHTYQ
ncbi:MAG TPA: hypothetical protein VKR56_12435 [Candidatus Cybelea sp.]|nr:hypothetical protein [Candidatus Cybelea sp.]